MPIYEYRCNGCGEVFEQLVMGSDTGESDPCPCCGAKDTGRILSTFSRASSESGDGSGPGTSPSCSPSGGFS